MLLLENISHRYGSGCDSLTDVNLSLGKGLFGLLGPNGAGKSTLMRIIVTLQAPTRGRVVLDGADASKSPNELRTRLGYLPQNFDAYPRATALQMLDHIATLKRMPGGRGRREVLAHALEQVNLGSVSHKQLGTFSGGMMQRFGVAQALLGSPRLIVVDEPTAGLDPEERHVVLNLLSEHADTALVLLSTHLVDDIEETCAEAAVLCGGRIVASGAVEAMLSKMVGKVWTCEVERKDLARYEAAHRLLSRRLSAGRLQIRVEALTSPGGEFSATPPMIEDVYFSVLKSART